MACRLIWVTPELCARWLDRQASAVAAGQITDVNPVCRDKLAALVHSMNTGIFAATEPLRFTDGILADGQHRCHAVIETQQPRWFWTNWRSFDDD